MWSQLVFEPPSSTPYPLNLRKKRLGYSPRRCSDTMNINSHFSFHPRPTTNKRTFDQLEADERPVASGSASASHSPSSSSEAADDDNHTNKRARSHSPQPETALPPLPELFSPSLYQTSGTLSIPQATEIPRTNHSESPPAAESPDERLRRSLAHSGAFERQLDLIRQPTTSEFVQTRWPSPATPSSDDDHDPSPISLHGNARSAHNNITNNSINNSTPSSSLAHALGPLRPPGPIPRATTHTELEDTSDRATATTTDTESIQDHDRDLLSDIDMDDAVESPSCEYLNIFSKYNISLNKNFFFGSSSSARNAHLRFVFVLL